jgi:hypothetical protein
MLISAARLTLRQLDLTCLFLVTLCKSIMLSTLFSKKAALTDQIRSGYAKKAATSKNSDECRGNWQERWFVLIGHELHYYKRKEDNTPKGSIDLRAARVDVANDRITGKPFCIRIAQAKQVFVYIQFNSEDDLEKWGIVLRIAAGYNKTNSSLAEEAKLQALTQKQGDLDPLIDIRHWDNRDESLCSYAGLILTDPQQEHPDRAVISLSHSNNGVIRIVKADNPWLSIAARQIKSVNYSHKPELNLLDTTGVRELYTATLIIQSLNNQFSQKFVFYMGNSDEAKSFCYALRGLQNNELNFVKSANNARIDESSYLEYADVSASSVWTKRFAVLTDRRILFFRTGASAVPTWVVSLWNNSLIQREGMKAIKIQTSLEVILLRFEVENLRDQWWDSINIVNKSGSFTCNKELRLWEEIEKKELDEKKQREHREKVALEQKKAADEYAEKQRLEAATAAAEAAAAAQVEAPKEKYIAPERADVKFDHLPLSVSEWGKGEPGYIIDWGKGSQGCLGNKSLENSLIPVAVEALKGKNIRSVSAGDHHVAATTEAGHVYIWGEGKSGELGCGERMLDSRSPYLLTALLKFGAIKYVSCGSNFTLAVSLTGEVFAWGNNSHGALGLGEGAERLIKYFYPVPVEFFKKEPARYISAGFHHSAAIKATGELVSWGKNVDGCLGLAGISVDQIISTPTAVSAINKLGPVESVSCGYNFTAAIVTIDDKRCLYSWGVNNSGQLGNADNQTKTTPGRVHFPIDEKYQVLAISCGREHSIALIKDEASNNNSIYTW